MHSLLGHPLDDLCRLGRLGRMTVLTAALFSASVAADTFQPNTGKDNHAALTFSPDGKTAYFYAWNGKWGNSDASKQTIYISRLKGDDWTKPRPADFTGKFSDSDPFVSPDGRWLYFVSDRPSDISDQAVDGNIWRYRLDGTTAPEFLSINSTREEYSPVVTASNNLYFASDREGGMGAGDIYLAEAHNDGFANPKRLGNAVNSETGEWNVWVSPDETEVLFEASSRQTNVSVPGDLYYSWRTAAGWTAAQPIVELNSRGSDLLPRLASDGQTLLYTQAPIGGHAEVRSVEWPRLRKKLRAEYARTLMIVEDDERKLNE